jgi:hypothetical protein
MNPGTLVTALVVCAILTPVFFLRFPGKVEPEEEEDEREEQHRFDFYMTPLAKPKLGLSMAQMLEEPRSVTRDLLIASPPPSWEAVYWHRNGVPIPGATDPDRYTKTQEDIGKSVGRIHGGALVRKRHIRDDIS